MRAGDRRSRSIKFRFCDTMGLEEDAGLEVSDIEKIIEGRVRDQTEVKLKGINMYFFSCQEEEFCPISQGIESCRPWTTRCTVSSLCWQPIPSVSWPRESRTSSYRSGI